jgi:ABC-type phosphate transport system substrate-binding protein
MQFFKKRVDWHAIAALLVRDGFIVAALLMMAGLVQPLFAQCPTGGLAVIVNKKSTVESLSTAQLRRLILGDVRNWPDQKPVAIVSREAASPVAQCVLSKIVRLTDGEYRRYIMNAEFRGEDPIVVQTANSDANAARAVLTAGSAFAVVDAASVPALSGQVKIVHINGKLPGEAGYPL